MKGSVGSVPRPCGLPFDVRHVGAYGGFGAPGPGKPWMDD